jgi:hypothetical protein
MRIGFGTPESTPENTPVEATRRRAGHRASLCTSQWNQAALVSKLVSPEAASRVLTRMRRIWRKLKLNIKNLNHPCVRWIW